MLTVTLCVPDEACSTLLAISDVAVACYMAPATGVACEYDYSAMAVIGIAVLFISPAASSTPFRVVETSLSKSYMSFSKGCARSLLADFTTFFLVPFDYFWSYSSLKTWTVFANITNLITVLLAFNFDYFITTNQRFHSSFNRNN